MLDLIYASAMSNLAPIEITFCLLSAKLDMAEAFLKNPLNLFSYNFTKMKIRVLSDLCLQEISAQKTSHKWDPHLWKQRK